MSLNHYDVITLGSSLATRLCAALLAKAGKRVLSIDSPILARADWPLCSPLTEQILTLIDGRSVLKPALDMQLINGKTRIQFNRGASLAQELRRELPQDAAAVEALLGQLQELGARLEKVLWDFGGPATQGIGARLRWRRTAWKHSLPWGRLTAPLSATLARSTPAAARFAQALFCGLSQRNADQISTGEAALLWGALGHSSALCPKKLDQLLNLRFDQFHGAREPLAQLQEIVMQGQSIGELRFRGRSERACTAAHFILSPEFSRNPVASGILPAATAAGQSAAALLNPAKVSTMLAPRFILGGEPPLRLSLEPANAYLECRVDFPARDAAAAEVPPGIALRVAERFPFDPPKLQPAQAPAGAVQAKERSLWKGLNLRCAPNAWLCPPPALSGLGSTGEFLAALSISRLIQQG